MSNDIVLTEDLLTGRMREEGLRLTLPRRAVVPALVDSGEPLISARMITDYILENAGRIGVSTVYGVLDDLARIGLVHHIPLRNGQSGRWHVTLDHDHEHLSCEFCNTTITIPASGIAPLFELLRDKYGFQTNPHPHRTG